MDKIENGMKFSEIVDIVNNALGMLVPIGTVVPYVGKQAPDGWLLCDGSTYSASDYPKLGKLFNALGGYFTVPDMRGKYLKGSDNGNVFVQDGNIKAWKFRPAAHTYNTDEFSLYSTTTGSSELPNVAMNFIIKY